MQFTETTTHCTSMVKAILESLCNFLGNVRITFFDFVFVLAHGLADENLLVKCELYV